MTASHALASKTHAGPPPIVKRPQVAVYLWLRGVKPRDLEEICGKGGEQIRRYLLPFSDPLHVPAPRDVVVRLIGWSGGEIQAHDFLPQPSRPELGVVK